MAIDAPKQTGPAKRKVITRRGFYEIIRSQLTNERSSFMSHWRDLGENILPRRPRFTVNDNNRGDRRNQKIIDSTATLAVRTLRSGMMSGITSPARPWFQLATPDPDLMDVTEVKDWLDIVTQLMRQVFLRSNLYNALPVVYGDMGCFGTSAMMIEEDMEDVVRFYVFPVGSYMLANDAKQKVRVFYREFRMTVAQLLEKFGKKLDDGNWDWSNFSQTVKNLWENNQDNAWVEVAHVIMANDQYFPNAVDSKYKKFRSCYYERGSSQNTNMNVDLNATDRFLRESGYDFFPVLAPRWETNAEDVYGTSCPGMEALGDIRALQLMQKRKAQAVEKMVNPPMTGPVELRSQKATILPGDITYVNVREGQQGFRPSHEVRPEVDKLLVDIQDHQNRIRRVFYEDLFLMLAMSDRREITAREIEERHEEKLLALGPVLEQLNQDLLDPLIDITFDMMLRFGLIPPPPQQLQGMDLRVEYVSVMAQAQKLVGIGGTERFTNYVLDILQRSGDPSHADIVDFDKLITAHADMVSAPVHAIRSEEQVNAIRDGRAQAAKAKAAMDTLQQGAASAKDLAGSDTGGQNALTDLLKTAKAGEIAQTP